MSATPARATTAARLRTLCAPRPCIRRGVAGVSHVRCAMLLFAPRRAKLKCIAAAPGERRASNGGPAATTARNVAAVDMAVLAMAVASGGTTMAVQGPAVSQCRVRLKQVMRARDAARSRLHGVADSSGALLRRQQWRLQCPAVAPLTAARTAAQQAAQHGAQARLATSGHAGGSKCGTNSVVRSGGALAKARALRDRA